MDLSFSKFLPVSDALGVRVEVKPLNVQTLNAFEAPWRDLAASASEPNPFLEPFMLRAALGSLPESAGAKLLLVWRGERLIGLFAWRRQMRFGRVPVLHMETMRHRHLYFGAPLVAAGREMIFARAFLTWLDRPSGGSAFASLPLLKADGPLLAAFKKAAHEDGRLLSMVERRMRAVVSRANAAAATSYEEHIQKTMSAQSRKKIRAKTRRLAALGVIGYETLNPCKDDEMAWLDDYLRFEHAGWKGEAGTSVLSDPCDEGFCREMVAAAAAEGRLKFSRLKVGDRPIAYSIDVLAGTDAGAGAFALKIAHDPAYECYSPGVLLEHANLKAFFEQSDYQWVDSCAASDHKVLNKLWGGEIAITHLAIARNDFISAFLLKAALSTASIKAWMRRVLIGEPEELAPSHTGAA